MRTDLTYYGTGLDTLQHKNSAGSIINSYEYTVGGDKNVRKIIDNGVTNTYSYDAADRLGWINGVTGEIYSFDQRSNIIQYKDNSLGITINYQYDARNQLLQAGSTTFTYDDNGNMLTKSNPQATYSYDEWNRLTNVTQSGTGVSYKYNGDGLMVERTEGGVTTRYYYDAERNIIAEGIVNGSTVTLKAAYIRGHALIYRQDASGNRAYYLHNGQGDVVELRSASGALLNEYSYDVWGNPETISETVDNPFRYSGEYWDDTTNLQYLRARWYDPSIHRFISEDPYQGDIYDPLTLNLYTYVNNNPLRYVDPTGFAACAADSSCDYTVYMVAGIATDDTFFDSLISDLENRYTEAGYTVHVAVIFPYGDNSSSVTGQMLDVKHDYGLAENNAQASIGGQNARSEMISNYGGGAIVIIGHSGGGVAGYHAGKMLEVLDGYDVQAIIQIGSPKVKISPAFQDKVFYLFDRADPVTLFGTWRGGFLNMNINKYAPGTGAVIDIKGNHTDYFNNKKKGKESNVGKVSSQIWSWLAY